ncbi:MAG: HEAT repeat domain-containing protein [Acidobacteria bacterium]|nr:HEAT repeat domain-containing protein [Acidobacteriota bacterium]MCA1609348.1 HEAT repeat domain-containing protein [Acidobacteriota bacterium]
MTRRGPVLAALLVCAGAALPAPAEGPSGLTNARAETRDASSGLERAFRAAAASASPVWIGYAVPSPEGQGLCCGDSWDGNGCSGTCALEPGRSSQTSQRTSRAELASGVRMLVFHRAEKGRTTRLRLFSDACSIDGGGMAVVWLTGVRPSESVALLSGMVAGGRDREDEESSEGRPSREALTAIALHEDPSADAALEKFALPPTSESIRKKAMFWLGNSRGRRGYEILKRLSTEEPSDSVRKNLTFALSQSPVPEAVSTLIEMAKRDESPGVRGQALFWLAHKAGRRAADAITAAIRDDPETEVKKKAVFALTQLPAEESTTQLIHVAKTNRNPAVRKQALFWLGQSKDPRALGYIEEVLTR